MVLGVIGALAAVGALLSGLALDWPALLIALAAFEGGWVFAIYTIALAYTFDRVAPSLALAANARLLAVFCVGSILGAGGSAAALSRVGAGGFFSVVGLASAGLALAAFHAWRIRDPLPMDERSDVVVVPRTSPVAAELDPRTEHSKEEDPRHEAEGPKVFSGC